MQRIVAPLLLTVGFLLGSPCTNRAAEPEKPAKAETPAETAETGKPAKLEKLEEDDGDRDGRKIRCKSPDGRYALLVTYRDEVQGEPDVVELVEIETQKILAKFNEDDSQYVNSRDAKLLWAPDSKRFAFYWGHRRGGFTDVYQKAGEGFKMVKMPKFPDLSDEPSTAFVKKHKWKFIKVITAHDESPVKWLKSGGLVIEASSAASGESGVWTRTHTLTIGFDAKGKASVLDVVKKESLD